MNVRFLKYILKRLLLSAATIVVVVSITFIVMKVAPGSPFNSEKGISASTLETLKKLYGLDKPVWEQYFDYIGSAFSWQFGVSIKKNRDVMTIINEGLKVSGIIGVLALVISVFLGIVFGSIAATHQNKWSDRLIMVLSTASVAMPSFIIASILLYVICVKLKWLPANGTTWQGYILPVLCLSLYPMAYITRLTRSSTLDVLNQDYIRTAKAKGLTKGKVLFKHALRNSLTPVITYLGPEFAYIITGSLVVEQIFGITGLGRTFTNSITNRDYPLIMGTTVFLTYIMVFMLLFSDILYTIVNPKVDFD
jgi:oligopeptide transport system permease protein